MTVYFDAVAAVLLIPALAAALLVALPGYRLTAAFNVFATFLIFLSAVSLFFGRRQPGPYLLVNDLNNVFIVLTTFVGFITSVFSAREAVIEGNIVADFPLCNKSFNCSYSGHDL